MCRHRKVHRERSEKIRKEFINIFPVGVGGHAPPMMFNPRPNFFRPTTSHHFRTDPLVVIKRDFFHLKSWIVSCIEQQRAWKVEKKHQRKKEIYVKRWYFFSCFEKRQKKKEKEKEKRKIIFPLSVLREMIMKGKFLSSRKHASREFYETPLKPVRYFPSVACAVVYWWLHFSFLSFYDSFRFSTIFPFFSFRFVRFFCAMRWWCFSHSTRLRLINTPRRAFQCIFSLPFELRPCAANFTLPAPPPLIGRSFFCMLVPVRRCYATSNTRSIIKHENSPLLRVAQMFLAYARWRGQHTI